MNGKMAFVATPGHPGGRAIRVVVSFAIMLLLGGIVRAQMQAAQPIPDLKRAPAATRVVAVTHCDREAIYRLTMQDGQIRPFAEINLRIKVDSTDNGPPPGIAVLLPAGMTGDRATLVFRKLADVSRIVKDAC